MPVPRERHKMKQKTDKTILIINAILFIFFEPAIVVNRCMTCALFKLDLKKNLSSEKNLSLKKSLNFEKPLSFEKKNPEF